MFKIFSIMIKKIIFSLICVGLILMFSCKESEKEELESHDPEDAALMYQTISELEHELFRSDEPDTLLAEKMIDKYVKYANKFPKDTASPEFLFKAAEIAINFGRPSDAVNYLSRIEARYKDFNKYGTCLFLKGFVYNYHLNNKAEAEKYYSRFIEEYPDHALVEDAKSALMFLDFDDKQLIEVFRNMN